jgi:ankyrin repeat protein
MKTKIIIITLLLVYSSTSNAQIFGKKKQSNPNLVKLQDKYPQTSGYAEDYDPNTDSNANPKLKYLYQNLIRDKDTLKVKNFMASSSIDYNFINSSGEPILNWVTENGSDAMLKHFLSNGSNPNLRTYYVEYGPMSMRYQTRESSTIYSKYPLEIALDKMDTIKLNLLKKYGADIKPIEEKIKVYSTDSRYSKFVQNFTGSNAVADKALWDYIYISNNKEVRIEKLKELISRGAKINYSDGCLYQALKRNDSYEIIEYLVKNGADTNLGTPKGSYTKGQPPLWFAICAKDLKLVKLLVENGANINAEMTECSRSSSGNRPVEMAINNNANDIVDYLFSKGAK